MKTADQLQEILDFLNDKKMRATYGAVAVYLGVKPLSMGPLLGEHSRRASWVVSARDHMPTDYPKEHLHPELLRTSLIIDTAAGLDRGLRQWREIRGR